MPDRDIVVVSNRGPLSFRLDGAGAPEPAGTAGGLAGTLHDLLAGSGAAWVACAMSEADRKAAAAGLMAEEGLRIVTVEPDPDVYRMAYDVVSNATLWFIHHQLFDLTRRPRFDRRWAAVWDAYRSVNEDVARAVADTATAGAVVLVQDYHLCLVPGLVAERRPDLRLVHFSHTPFCDPSGLRVLPDAAADELLAGMAAATCGFHTARWRDAFVACCADRGVPVPSTFVSPLAPDPERLAARAQGAACRQALERVTALTGGRRMVLRVDRLEPSKNLLRGFWAFDELLETRPDWRGRVVFVALAYPSRQTLPEYLAYGTEAELVARQINERWGDGDWTPVVLEVADDAARSLAALTAYDVLLVNPQRDGLNLVAKEGPVVNTAGGVVVLSREAGAYEELAGQVLGVNPFDVAATARAMAEALDLDPVERARRAAALRARVTSRTPRDWLDEQLAAGG